MYNVVKKPHLSVGLMSVSVLAYDEGALSESAFKSEG
jgi:hypothetical protein